MLSFTTFLTLALMSSYANADGAINLRVEYLTAPLTIDTPLPRFSFLATCGEPSSRCTRGTTIGLVHITVTALPTGASVWDAQLSTSRTSQIEYAGTPLLSNADYAWTVSWARRYRCGNEQLNIFYCAVQ